MNEETEAPVPAREPLIAGLAGEARALRQDVRDEITAVAEAFTATAKAIEQRGVDDRRAFFRRNLMLWAVLVVAFVVLGLWNRSTLSTIQSCTDPHGDCYQRAQANQAQVVTSLLTSFCAGIHPEHPQAAQRCLTSALAVMPPETP